MRYLKVLFLVLIVFVFMMFFIQNYEVVSTSMPLRLDLYFKAWVSIPMPVYFLLLVAFLVGALFTIGFFLQEKITLSARLKRARSQIGKLEKELNSLRNMGVEGKMLPEATPEKSSLDNGKPDFGSTTGSDFSTTTGTDFGTTTGADYSSKPMFDTKPDFGSPESTDGESKDS